MKIVYKKFTSIKRILRSLITNETDNASMFCGKKCVIILNNKRVLFTLFGFIIASISLFVGALDVSLELLFDGNMKAWHVLFYSRIPRVIAVVLSGFSLAVSGLIMQKIANNRFVSPSTAVTIDGARLGIILSYLVFTHNSLIYRTALSLLSAAVCTLLFLAVIRSIRFKNTIFVPLLGIVMGLIIDSFTNFLAMRMDLVQVLTSYSTGSFASILQGKYEILYFCIPLTVLALHYSFRFNIVAMGSSFASNIGLNTNTITIIGLMIVSSLSAGVMVTVGTIPFIGLIVPNIISQQLGEGHPKMLLDTGIMGAVLLLTCDLISRLIIYPYELPVSFVLGIVGSVLFLLIIIRGYYGKKI